MILRSRAFALGVVLAHFGVTLLHSQAHQHLKIPLSTTQYEFVLLVILAAPLLAAMLLLARATRAGALLLLGSMAGSLVFGGYNHFVAAGADNVASYPLHAWGGVFQATSVLLFLAEALGCVTAAALLKPEPR